MMPKFITLKDRSYKVSFCCAVVLHVIIGAFLCVKLVEISRQPALQSGTNIVQAFSISQSDVEGRLISIAAVKQEAVLSHPEQIQKEPSQQQPLPQPKQQQLQQMQKQTSSAAVVGPAPARQKKTEDKLAATMKARLLEEQEHEMQSLKKELQAQQEAVAATQKAHKAQQEEARALQDVLHQELAAEGKSLQSKKQQLNAPAAVAAATASAATNAASSASQGVSVKDENKSMRGAADQQEIDKYKALIVQAISQEWIIPESVDRSASCKLLITLAPGGVVLSVQLVQTSNNQNLDRSAQTAIWKASPLPVPPSKELFDDFRAIRLTVRPQEIVSG